MPRLQRADMAGDNLLGQVLLVWREHQQHDGGGARGAKPETAHRRAPRGEMREASRPGERRGRRRQIELRQDALAEVVGRGLIEIALKQFAGARQLGLSRLAYRTVSTVYRQIGR